MIKRSFLLFSSGSRYRTFFFSMLSSRDPLLLFTPSFRECKSQLSSSSLPLFPSNVKEESYLINSEHSVQLLWNVWDQENQSDCPKDFFDSLSILLEKSCSECLELKLSSLDHIESATRFILAVEKWSSEITNKFDSIRLVFVPSFCKKVPLNNIYPGFELVGKEHEAEVEKLREAIILFLGALTKSLGELSSIFKNVTSLEFVEINNETSLFHDVALHHFELWNTSLCTEIASLILKSTSIKRLTFRDLRFTSAELKTNTGFLSVLDALALRCQENNKNPIVQLQLFSMNCILHCSHFLFNALPKMTALRSLTINHTPLLVQIPLSADDYWKTLSECLSVVCWDALLQGLRNAVGGWYRLTELCVVDCGLRGNCCTKSLLKEFEFSSFELCQTIPHLFTGRSYSVCSQSGIIQRLDISRNPLGLASNDDNSGEIDETIFNLSCCLRRCPLLQSLNASRCSFGSKKMNIQLIGEGLAVSSKSLISLDFSSNPISDEGALTLLASFLGHDQFDVAPGSHSCALKELNLSRCGLSIRFIHILSELMLQMKDGFAYSSTEIDKKDFFPRAFPHLSSIRLAMNIFRPISPELLFKYVSETHRGDLYPGKNDPNNQETLHLFSYNPDCMSGNSAFRNRGSGKVITSYELDRKDTEEGRKRWKGELFSKNNIHCCKTIDSFSNSCIWKQFGHAISFGCPKLKLLDMWDTEFSEESASSFFSCLRISELECLNIACNPIFLSTTSIEHLNNVMDACCRTLKVFDVSSSQFDDYSLSVLCDGVHCGGADNFGIFFTSKMKKLSVVNISYTKVSDVGIETFIAAAEEKIAESDEYSIGILGTLKTFLCTGNKISEPVQKRFTSLFDNTNIKIFF